MTKKIRYVIVSLFVLFMMFVCVVTLIGLIYFKHAHRQQQAEALIQQTSLQPAIERSPETTGQTGLSLPLTLEQKIPGKLLGNQIVTVGTQPPPVGKLAPNAVVCMNDDVHIQWVMLTPGYYWHYRLDGDEHRKYDMFPAGKVPIDATNSILNITNRFHMVEVWYDEKPGRILKDPPAILFSFTYQPLANNTQIAAVP